MPATVETVQNHLVKQVKAGKEPPYEKLFNLSKNTKEDPPLTGFIEYYAYKVEERKYQIRYENVGAQNSKLAYKDREPFIPYKLFLEYCVEKKFDRREYFISKHQYMDLDFINESPEIVNDVLFFLSGYVHHRTNLVSYETYKTILQGQVSNSSIQTKEQISNYQEDGWKYDGKGILAQVDALTEFSLNFKHFRDMPATEEEKLLSKKRIV